jgi:hypothetical protein
MKKKEYIKEIIRSFHINALPTIKPRELSVPTNSGKIVTLCGVRRCGKTYILYQTISELLESGVDKKRIVYINFEDERLDLSSDELDLVLQAYRELYELDIEECYLFFDEIQNISGWEQFIRRIYDTLSKNIFITGSNAKLLSAEIATSLRGRNISYEVYPLSFSEYLSFIDFTPDIYNPNHKARLKNAFLEYMKNGGFPETIGMSADIRANTLQGYFDVMIYRDIIERYDEKNSSLLKYFIKRVLSTFTKAISINKIYNELKSSGYKVGKNTLYQYFDYIETIYLGFALRRYDPSMLKSELSEKKTYLIDNGLLLSVSFAFSDDYGKLLENIVFLELKRSGKDIFYYKDKKECDFVVFDRDRAIEAIQVCYDMSDKDTRDREIAGLLEACKALGLSSGVIVTMDEDDEFDIEGIHIKLVSVYRYLMNNE